MDVKIKLSSKRLSSGRCQVRFQVRTNTTDSGWYGYALAEPQDTLREVVDRIESRFRWSDDKASLHQKVHYNFHKYRKRTDDVMVFRES